METLSPEKLMHLVQIELRCVQECVALFDSAVPDSVCDLMCQHAEAAHQFSEILWTVHHHRTHGHPPSQLGSVDFPNQPGRSPCPMP